VSSHELEREKQKVEELRISLAAALADAEHNRKLTATATAQLKAALGNDRYEEQQRKRIARSVETQRTRCLRRLLESRFIDWKLSVQVSKAMAAAQADATPEELAELKEKQAAESEQRGKEQAELARLKQEHELAQQANAEVLSKLREEEELRERKTKEELMKAAFAQTQLPIKGCKCLGAVPVHGDSDKPYIVYRMLVSVVQDKGGTPEMRRPWYVRSAFFFSDLPLNFSLTDRAADYAGWLHESLLCSRVFAWLCDQSLASPKR